MTRRYDDSLPLTTIYAAEQNVQRTIQRGGAAEFFGSTLDLDRCRIRTYTPDQRMLMQGMVAGLYSTFRHGVRQDPPTLRMSLQAERGWYHTGKHEIVLPARRWAWNDMTLCHEVAHACDGAGHDQRSAHGKSWRKTYAAMVAEVVGPEAGLLLSAALDL